MNYYERHIGDYLKDTAHLSLLEHGVYGRLLDVYYTREGAISVDQVERLIGARTDDELAALAVVLDEFFTVDDGALHNSRCDREIERYREKQRKAANSAKTRWSNANAVRTHSERIANALPTQCEGNAPNHQSPDTSITVASTKAVGGPRPPVEAPPTFSGESDLQSLNGKHIVPLATGWELPEPWGIDAEALGWKSGDVLREAEKFRQYWTAGRGAGTRRSVKGWRQTWSNWLEKAAKDKR